MRTPLALIGLLALAGCANDLRVDHPFDGQVNAGPLVDVTVLDNGLKQVHVDATNKGSQVFVDLDEGREMKADEAFSTNGWDLAFKRYEIAINSGDANPTGVVEAAILKEQDFDSLSTAPADGYATGIGAQMSEVNGANAWFSYELSAHGIVTRSDIFYVVKSSAGAYFKFKMISYYDASGTPASLTFEYGALAAP